jgi:hypothetical protein
MDEAILAHGTTLAQRIAFAQIMPRANILTLRAAPLASKEISHASSCVLKREDRKNLDATDFAKLKA